MVSKNEAATKGASWVGFSPPNPAQLDNGLGLDSFKLGFGPISAAR